MAESILRLKVESSEYDAKLKQAADGLTRYVDGCRKVGGTLEVVEKETLDYVRAIGQMETHSRTATGKLGEMKRAFIEFSAQYKQMTDQEKASPMGKALAQSLEELKGRIGESKTQLDDINKSMLGGGGLSDALNSVAGKFGLNIDQLTKFGSVMGATTAAVKVAKDAFFQCESNVDEYGRTVEASKAVYDSFLQTLNNGDFSGFLKRLGEVISKAKDAYNALDELGTRMTIINPERAKLQARSTELKSIIRRKGADSAEGKAAQSELKQLEVSLTKAFEAESKMNYNAFKAKVDEKLQNAGIKLGKKDYDFLMRTFSSDASFMAMRRGARGKKGYDVQDTGRYGEDNATYYDTRNINQKLLDLFTDEWRNEYSPLLTAAFNARGSAASAMLSDARYIRETGGGSGKGGKGGGAGAGVGAVVPEYAPDSIAAQQALVSELSKKINEAGAIVRDQYVAQWIEAEEVLKRMKNEVALLKEQAHGKLLENNEVQTEGLGSFSSYQSIDFTGIKGIEKLQTISDLGNATKESWKGAAASISAIGGAISSIEDPAAKIVGTIGQAIATIALAYAETLGKDKTSKSNIYLFMATAAATMISLASTVASLHSATGYATGGLIPGNNYSGDQTPAMVNSGELILNRAQQGNIASQLQDGGRGMHIVGQLRGEDIILVANRTFRRKGQGEIVTW